MGLTCLAGCGFRAPQTGGTDAPPDTEPMPMIDRATAGLIAYWRFDEASGDVAGDSRMALVAEPPLAPVPLQISNVGHVAWGGGGLRLDAPVRVGTMSRPHVSDDVLRSGEVTLEAWVSPAVVAQGEGVVSGVPNYALVLSLSPSHAYHNAMIAQVGDRWHGRVLTAATSTNGIPAIETPDDSITDTGPVHLVLVASATERALYVNGVPHRAPSPGDGIGRLNDPAAAARWYDYFPVSIGQERDNAVDHPRTWLGTIWLAAIYDRALTEAEIRQNLAARHDCAGC